MAEEIWDVLLVQAKNSEAVGIGMENLLMEYALANPFYWRRVFNREAREGEVYNVFHGPMGQK
jgi:hypothetical protein